MLRTSMMMVVAALAIGCGGKANEAAEPAPEPTEPTDPAATGEQSFADAMRILCDSPTTSGVVAEEDASMKATRLAEWITERVTNPEAVTLFQDLGAVAPEEKTRLLNAAIARVGIAEPDCQFLQLYQPPPAP